MNEIFAISGIAIVSAGLVVLLKQYKPEYAFGAAFAAGIIIISYAFSLFSDIFKALEKLVSLSETVSDNIGILLHCLGICAVTKIASEACKDCGQASIASKVDFAGKIFILITALPLFSEINEIIKALIYI